MSRTQPWVSKATKLGHLFLSWNRHEIVNDWALRLIQRPALLGNQGNLAMKRLKNSPELKLILVTLISVCLVEMLCG